MPIDDRIGGLNNSSCAQDKANLRIDEGFAQLHATREASGTRAQMPFHSVERHIVGTEQGVHSSEVAQKF